MNRLFTIFISLLIFSCENQSNVATQADSVENEEEECVCTTPTAYIHFIPYGDVKTEELNKLKQQVAERLDTMIYGCFTYDVVPKREFLQKYKSTVKKGRYRADKVLHDLNKEAKTYDLFVGVTHEDICLDYKNKKDWGVLGLAFRPSHACIVSTHRIRNPKRDLWKVTIHEILHALMGYPHCPSNNPNCIMKDANGHADFRNKVDLCKDCKRSF